MQKRTTYSGEFKREAVRPLERGEKPAAELARELSVGRNQLYKWQEQLAAKGESALPCRGDAPATRMQRLRV